MTAPLSNLTSTQQANAAAIVSQVKAEGLPLGAAQIAITVALVESALRNDANSGIPASLSIPHDAVGSDHTSLGLFQQQNSWGTALQRMTPATATSLFLARLPSGWQGMDPGKVAQQIQVSAYPDRYDQAYPQGAAIAAALWNGTAPGSTQNASLTSGTDKAPVWKSVSGAIISAPPAGTYEVTTTSTNTQGYKPSVTASTMTDAQGDAILAWLKLYLDTKSSALDWKSPLLSAPWSASNGGPSGFNTRGAVLIQTYAQALQGNGLDTGAAVPGLGIDPLGFLKNIIAWITNKDNWIRIGLGLAGALILLIVLLKWFSDTPTGQATISAAKVAAVA